MSAAVPEMILFDYGQTLINAEKYDGIRGCRAVLRYATQNPAQASPEQIWARGEQVMAKMHAGMVDGGTDTSPLDMTAGAFHRYLFALFDLKFSVSEEELETVFMDAAEPGTPTAHIRPLLEYLKQNGIRTGVVSNLMETSKTLRRRLERLIPGNGFEFVMTSGDYLFRKLGPDLFEVALVKAKLPAERIWFCGDNLLCDVAGSRSAGMRPVWYRGYLREPVAQGPGADCICVDDWKELIDRIEEEKRK